MMAVVTSGQPRYCFWSWLYCDPLCHDPSGQREIARVRLVATFKAPLPRQRVSHPDTYLHAQHPQPTANMAIIDDAQPVQDGAPQDQTVGQETLHDLPLVTRVEGGATGRCVDAVGRRGERVFDLHDH